MKKFLSLILAAMMMLCSCSCGKEDELAQLQLNESALESENNNLTDALIEAKITILQQSDELDEANAVIEKQTAELDEANAVIEKQTAQLEQSEQKIAELTLALSNAEQIITEKNNKIAQLEQSNAKNTANSNRTQTSNSSKQQASSSNTTSNNSDAQSSGMKLTGKHFLSDVEQDIVDEINKLRRSKGLNKLIYNENLEKAARIRSKEMYVNGYFEHERPNGDSWETILTEDVPMNVSGCGENLAFAKSDSMVRHQTGEEWFEQWESSPSHYENMVRPQFTHIGVGVYYAVDEDGEYHSYATTVFAIL
ncbi:MAG: hypothetical protein IKV41_07035 [Oscillospiraceae bacterium]|nr:hypothetical protein [Oscillospiraceae bacterium]